MSEKYRIYLIIVLVIGFFIFITPESITVPAEKIDIITGLGIDMIQNEQGENKIQSSISVYNFTAGADSEKSSASKSVVRVSIADTLLDARERRQLSSNRKFVSSFEKVAIIGENLAKNGLNSTIDFFFYNPFSSDSAWVVVCKGQALDILQQEVKGYPDSARYIDGLIEQLQNDNFFSSEYNILHMYSGIGAEGKCVVLPYIEMVDNVLTVTGMALFKKDKMVRKIDIPEARIMNMLREKKGNGILTLQKDFKHYTSSYIQTQKKISCSKSGDKYNFTINLELKTEVMNNTLFKDMEKHDSIIAEYEQALQQQVEYMCQEFIKKMQTDYKIDCLELGEIACAKYGRGTGVDWNEIVCNSDIKVNVKVKVERFGRGRYTIQ